MILRLILRIVIDLSYGFITFDWPESFDLLSLGTACFPQWLIDIVCKLNNDEDLDVW